MKTQFNIVTTSGVGTTYSVLDNDYIINADGGCTITLPAMNNLEQREVIVFDYSFAAAGTYIYVDGNGASVGTNGQSNYEMRHNGEVVSFRYCNGTRKVSSSFVQGRFIPGSVLFSGAQGEISEGNVQFFYDYLTNRLRIDNISQYSGNDLNLGIPGNVVNNVEVEGNVVGSLMARTTLDTDTYATVQSIIGAKRIEISTLGNTWSSNTFSGKGLLQAVGQELYIQCANGASSNIAVCTQNGAIRQYTTSSGNVGIGSITTPSARLHVNATSTATGVKISNSATGSTIADGFDLGITVNGVAEIRQRENLAIETYTNNALRETISAAGLHGIGVVPVSMLDVNGRTGSAITSYAGLAVTLDNTTSTAVFTGALVQTITMPPPSTNNRAVYTMVNPSGLIKTLNVSYTTLSGGVSTTLPINSSIILQCNGTVRRQIG